MHREPKIVGSTRLRNQVGRVLDDALAGQTTIIERHGRRVARVVPYGEYSRLETRLAQLEYFAERMLGPDWEQRLTQLDPASRAS